MIFRLKPISNELKLERIKYENPWWITNEIEEQYLHSMQKMD
jgi:hypothetical protein